MAVGKLIRRSGVKVYIARAATGSSATVNDEAHKLDTNGVAYLQFPASSVTTVKKGGSPLVVNTDYVVAQLGGRTAIVASGGSLSASDDITVTYNYNKDGTVPDTPIAIGRVKNQIQLSDNRGTFTVTDFDTLAGAINEQLTDGRTVGVTFGTNLVPDDVGQVAAEEAYDDDEVVWMKFVATTIDGSTVKTWGYKGFLNNYSPTLNETNVSETSIGFVASEKYDWM